MRTYLLHTVITSLLLGSAWSATPAPTASEQRVTNWLKQQDPNQDGKIARDEATGLMKKFFDRNDTSGDGVLDRGELHDLAGRLEQRKKKARPQPAPAANERIRAMVPEGVEVELDIAYREGNDFWKLDLAHPKAESKSSPRPAIVFVHGGGWVGGDKRKGNFIGPALQYAQKGYVTVSVNYRLTREILPCVEDVKCAVRWLRAHAEKYNIDPNRIGAYGNSAGAHLVVMLAISHTEPRLEGDGPWKDFSSQVQAVVASATPTLPRFGSASDEVKKLVAPITYVDADVPPMLLIHDESDKTVPVVHADEFTQALKKAGAKDITYKRYTNKSGHGVFGRNAKETVPMMEAFFARTLAE